MRSICLLPSGHRAGIQRDKKMESLLGNLMLSYKKEWRKHFLMF